MPALLMRMPTEPSCDFDGGDQSVDFAGDGHVGLDGDAFAAGGADGLADGLGGFGLGAIVYGDVCASFG